MERDSQQVLLVPQSAQDIVHIALRFSGPLDIPALRAALGVLVGSHALSRTRFALIDDMLVPAILLDDEFSLPLCDLWDAETPNADAAVDEILSKEARDSFDLDAGPLFRCRLLRIGLEDHVLSLVWHRIIADPESAGRLCAELPAIYDAVRTNRSVPAVQHDLDFGLRWGLAAPPMLEEHGTYWLERLIDGQRRCGAGEWNAGLRAAVIRSVAMPVELHLELVLEAAAKGAESPDNPGPTFQGPFEGMCLSGCHSAFGDDLD